MVYSCATAFIAVYNQVLNQSSNASLHADNMVLFSVGSFTNLAIHLIVRWWSPYEPGILAGYTDPVAVVLVLSSVFIGLAATAVYKCMSSYIDIPSPSLSSSHQRHSENF